ncbi:hypothetical protein Q8A67_019805 [Cirrhinus molitorella]|uniref:Uncharacterized protein n=1 Tax=Cirrhinus molitorella TaxID=172907 RepID=A0AA88P7T7_9TELE|nr:hypothetical protein Q8A67_019805 [Cirrhinus molitorella]
MVASAKEEEERKWRMEGCLQQLKAKENTPFGFACALLLACVGGDWTPEAQEEGGEGQHSNRPMGRKQPLIKYLRSAFYLSTADSASYLA